MRSVSERLQQLIEKVVVGLDYELVGIEFDRQHKILRVYIDIPHGIQLDDCTKVSHQLSGTLDIEDPINERYRLEISSPGIDRPLFTLQHYKRLLGSTIQLTLLQNINGRRRIKGKILSAEDDVIVIQETAQTLEIPFAQIGRARLVPDWQTTKRTE